MSTSTPTTSSPNIPTSKAQLKKLYEEYSTEHAKAKEYLKAHKALTNLQRFYCSLPSNIRIKILIFARGRCKRVLQQKLDKLDGAYEKQEQILREIGLEIFQ